MSILLRLVVICLLSFSIFCLYAQADEERKLNDRNISVEGYIVSGSGLGTGINVDYKFNSILAGRISYAAQAGTYAGVNWDGSIYGGGIYLQAPYWVSPYVGFGLVGVSITGNNGGTGSAGGITYFAGIKTTLYNPSLNIDLAYNGLAQGATLGLNYIF